METRGQFPRPVAEAGACLKLHTIQHIANPKEIETCGWNYLLPEGLRTVCVAERHFDRRMQKSHQTECE